MTKRPAGRRRPRPDQAGFTLLELLVVLAVLVLVYAALPAGLRPGSRTLEQQATARDIAQVLRAARGQAIAGNREVVFYLDVEERRYGIAGGARSGDFSDNLEIRFLTAREELRDPAEGAIRFFPDGSATGGDITVGGAGRVTAVSVRWLTGQVTLDE